MVNLKFWTWLRKKELSDNEKFMKWLSEQHFDKIVYKGGVSPVEVDCKGISLSVARIKKCENLKDLKVQLEIKIKSSVGAPEYNYEQTLIQVESLPPYIPQ